MQKSPPTPSATSWSSRAANAPVWRGVWLCTGESVPGSESDTGTHPALRALGRDELTIYIVEDSEAVKERLIDCLLYTSPSPRDRQKSRMPSSA